MLVLVPEVGVVLLMFPTQRAQRLPEVPEVASATVLMRRALLRSHHRRPGFYLARRPCSSSPLCWRPLLAVAETKTLAVRQHAFPVLAETALETVAETKTETPAGWRRGLGGLARGVRLLLLLLLLLLAATQHQRYLQLGKALARSLGCARFEACWRRTAQPSARFRGLLVAIACRPT